MARSIVLASGTSENRPAAMPGHTLTAPVSPATRDSQPGTNGSPTKRSASPSFNKSSGGEQMHVGIEVVDAMQTSSNLDIEPLAGL